MEFWTMPMSMGDVFMDFSVLSLLLIGGTLLRKHVSLFSRFLIPGSLIAGFIGLILGPELLSLIPFSLDRMGAYVYHLLAITFIGVGLQSRRRKHGYNVVNLGFMQVVVMLLQAVIGLTVALVVASTFFPSLSPASGMLLPLGFAMGPGIAFSIGNSWRIYGFDEAASVGLSIAAIGFMFAYITGMWIVNRRLAAMTPSEIQQHIERQSPLPEHEPTSKASAAKHGFGLFRANIEPLTTNVAIIGLVYLATWGVVSLLAEGLSFIGLSTEIPILWSFHFIVANLLALLLGRFLGQTNTGFGLDEVLLRRTTAMAADFLIAASIAAISLNIAWSYVTPILFMCILGAATTYGLLRWTSERVFHSYRFERFIGMYAQMTGTISSGLALIRVTDPEYRSPVAEDLVLSSGIALGLGFPLLLVINMPFTLFSGSFNGYLFVLALLLGYLSVIAWLWVRFVRSATPGDGRA